MPSNIDFSQFRPDPEAFDKSQDWVNRMYQFAAKRDAGALYAAGDYQGASNRLAGVGDFETAGKLSDRGTALSAGKQYAAGDFEGAGKTLASGGQFTAAETLAEKQAARILKQQEQLGKVGSFLEDASKDPATAAQAWSWAAQNLQAVGVKPETIAQLNQLYTTNPKQAIAFMKSQAAKKLKIETNEGTTRVIDENTGQLLATYGDDQTFHGTSADVQALSALVKAGYDPTELARRWAMRATPTYDSALGTLTWGPRLDLAGVPRTPPAGAPPPPPGGPAPLATPPPGAASAPPPGSAPPAAPAATPQAPLSQEEMLKYLMEHEGGTREQWDAWAMEPGDQIKQLYDQSVEIHGGPAPVVQPQTAAGAPAPATTVLPGGVRVQQVAPPRGVPGTVTMYDIDQKQAFQLTPAGVATTLQGQPFTPSNNVVPAASAPPARAAGELATERAKTLAAREKDLPGVRTALANLKDQRAIVYDALDRLIGKGTRGKAGFKPGLVDTTPSSYGAQGALFAGLPGTVANQVANELKTVLANIGFDKLQALRDAAKSGGALGQVSNFEETLLQASMGSVNQEQRDFPEALRRLRATLQRMDETRQRTFEDTYGDLLGTANPNTGGANAPVSSGTPQDGVRQYDQQGRRVR